MKTTRWGGPWTKAKLEAFVKYVNAYLTIMNKNRDKYNWKLIYFDGFAGSGDVLIKSNSEIKEKKTISLLQEIDELEKYSGYKGAAERVLDIKQKGFDYYYFIDTDEVASNKLEKKLKPYKKDYMDFCFRIDDANNQIRKMAEFLKQDNKHKSLVFLDPFGMNIEWASIECLKGTSTDLWVLIPSGVVINRLLKCNGEILNPDKMCSFFGLTENELQTEFYKKEESLTLFGETTEVKKYSEPLQRIANLCRKRLKTIYKYVTKPLPLKNSKNNTIYHFIFASNNKSAHKIADQIIIKNQCVHRK